MYKVDLIDESLSKYYDNEMKESELLSFEAKIVNSNYIKDYINQKCFEYYKISSSINRTKEKLKLKSNKLTDEIINKNHEKLFFNFYTVIFKRVNKYLRRLSLNILRNNSQ